LIPESSPASILAATSQGLLLEQQMTIPMTSFTPQPQIPKVKTSLMKVISICHATILTISVAQVLEGEHPNSRYPKSAKIGALDSSASCSRAFECLLMIVLMSTNCWAEESLRIPGH